MMMTIVLKYPAQLPAILQAEVSLVTVTHTKPQSLGVMDKSFMTFKTTINFVNLPFNYPHIRICEVVQGASEQD